MGHSSGIDHLALPERPYELYRYASDETRRQLNQVIFKRIYVVNEEVTGDELNAPMRELLPAERGWASLSAGGDIDTATSVAAAHAERHGAVPNEKQAAESDDLLDDFMLAALPGPAESGDVCSTPRRVRKVGLEPTRLSTQEPKSCVSTISPLPRGAGSVYEAVASD